MSATIALWSFEITGAEPVLASCMEASSSVVVAFRGRLDHGDGQADAPLDDELTVAAAYQRWGDACVRHLRGDWAFVLWDRVRRRVLCAKDPIGWQPLYYRVDASGFEAGGAPLELAEAGSGGLSVDGDYLRRFLGGAFQRPHSTPYSGVRELEGGELLAIEGGRARRSRYWRSPVPDGLPRGSTPPEYIEAFARRYRDAVRVRLSRSGRTAIYLSGGLDSSYLAAVAAGSGADVVALTAFSSSNGVDERSHARAVASALDLEHVEVDVSDCWSFSEEWLPLEACDDPAMPPQAPIMRKLAAAAAELGCDAVLTGDGGDEWLSGDPRSAADALADRRPRTAWRLARHAAMGQTPTWRVLAAQLRDGVRPRADASRLRARAGTSAGTEGGRAAHPLLVERSADWPLLGATRPPSLWPRGARLRRDWDLYRAATRAPLAWRHRHATEPLGLRLGAPSNELALLELMAGTPEWVKRFRGRGRDLLREAGSRLLPEATFARGDKVYFDGLMARGLDAERPRVMAAAERVARESGVDALAIEAALSEGRCDGRIASDDPLLRITAAGLWLMLADVRREAAVPRTRDRGSSQPAEHAQTKGSESA